jgi:hypothetical protein
MRCRTRIAIALLALVFCFVTRGDAQQVPPVNTDPLRIIFASSPAVLIKIDGDPVYRGVDGTDLQQIVNTTAFIVREPHATFYLRARHVWMEAYQLTGDWTISGAPPDGADDALRRATSVGGIDFVEVGELEPPGSRARTIAIGLVPTIYVSTRPTELIITDGPPRFVPFAGTGLEYIENTPAHVFKEPTDGELYVFVSERWYRAWTADGPSEFVATRDLPADLAGVPATSLNKDGTSRALNRR